MGLSEASAGVTLTVLPSGAIEIRKDRAILDNGVEIARRPPFRRVSSPESPLTDPAERAAASAAIAVLTAALR